MAHQIPLVEAPRRQRHRWLVAAAILLAATLAVVILAPRSEYRDLPFFSLWSVFDRTFESPTTKTRVRLIVTDQGALGYGCAVAYSHSDRFGYREIWKHCPVDSQSGVAIEWITDSRFHVTFTDPHAGRGAEVEEVVIPAM